MNLYFFSSSRTLGKDSLSFFAGITKVIFFFHVFNYEFLYTLKFYNTIYKLILKMFESFVFYIIIYFICCLSILGYGLILANYSKKYIGNVNLGEIGILGILFTIIYSTISHISIAHGYVHNLCFISVGLISFFYYYKKISSTEKIILIIVFLIIFISFPTFKSHDDFSYYQLISYHLLQSSLDLILFFLHLFFLMTLKLFLLQVLNVTFLF